MHKYAGKTEDLGHSPSTDSNRRHQWSHSSFGLWELRARRGCRQRKLWNSEWRRNHSDKAPTQEQKDSVTQLAIGLEIPAVCNLFKMWINFTRSLFKDRVYLFLKYFMEKPLVWIWLRFLNRIMPFTRFSSKLI